MAKNGLHLITPTSIAYTGISATISANGSVTFTACSALSLNGVFSADYDNYMIVMQHVHTTSAGAALYFRMRSSGSDASGSNYTWQYLTANTTSIFADRSADTAGRFGNASNNLRTGDVAFIYSPYLSQPTATRNTASCGQTNAQFLDFASTHSLSTSYDGITLYPDTMTFTGRIAVYGMRK